MFIIWKLSIKLGGVFMSIKKIISIILTLTLISSSTIAHAQNELQKPKLEIINLREDVSGRFLEETIKFGDSIIYNQISDESVISITIYNNCIVDYAHRDKSGVITYSNEVIPLKQLRILDFSEKNSSVVFQTISSMIAEKELPVINPTTITLEQINMSYSKGNMNINSFPPYESIFRSEMEAYGFSDYYGKVVATRYPRGIPATVKEYGDLYVAKVSAFWTNLSTAIGVLTAVLGVSSGTLIAVGIFIVTVAGVVEAAANQGFDTYDCQWAGGKWVELHFQGNYYQASRSVSYKGAVGINGSYLEKRSEYSDPYYFNDTQLCELTAMNY